MKSGKIRFIDFGMVVKKKEYLTQSLVNANERAQSWYYYPPDNSCAQKYIFEHGEKCKVYRKRTSFDTFLEKTINTFDSYCLTFCLSKLFHKIEENTGDMFSPVFFHAVQPLLRQFCHADVLQRNDDVDFLSTQYNDLLVKHGMYMTQKPKPSSESIDLADKLSILRERCVSGKRRNKKTGRCVTYKKIKG